MKWLGFRPNIGNVGGKALPHRESDIPLVGYRTWRVRHNVDGDIALHALHQGYEWQLENTAACAPFAAYPNHSPHPESPSPAINCQCGLYAQLPDQPIDEWNSLVRGRVRATGTIAMHGRIIRCERGFKAEHAVMQSPVILEGDCFITGCTEMVTRVEPVAREWHSFCSEHSVTENLLSVEVWAREAVRQLTVRYPGIEFIPFFW